MAYGVEFPDQGWNRGLYIQSVKAQPLDFQEVPTLFSCVYYTYKIVSCKKQHYFIYLKEELANI